jgi:hypothetical protein
MASGSPAVAVLAVLSAGPGSPSTASSPLVRTWTLDASSGDAGRPVRQSVLRQAVVI